MTIVTGKSYILTPKMKIIGPYDNALEASKDAQNGDVICNIIEPVHPKPKVKQITVDFDSLQVITLYDDKTENVEEIQDVTNFLKKDLTKLKEPVIKGTPPIEGDCLDEMLYM